MDSLKGGRSRGYASLSFAHEIASTWNRIEKPIHAFYLGDFDPSGFDLGEATSSPAVEQFLGKLIKKAAGVVKKVASAAKNVAGKVISAIPGLGAILNKLKGLIRPLLNRVQPGTDLLHTGFLLIQGLHELRVGGAVLRAQRGHQLLQSSDGAAQLRRLLPHGRQLMGQGPHFIVQPGV